MSYRASIIVPVLNESHTIVASLKYLQVYREQGCELIVVDGGSDDDTADLANPYVDQLIVSAAGRARQMNSGAAAASGLWLLFLHIDTLPPDNPALLLDQLERCCNKQSDKEKSIKEHSLKEKDHNKQWCFCQVRLSGSRRVYRMVEWFMNQRSWLTHIPTGDQLLCFKRDFFTRHNGYAELPLMEDVEIAKRLRGEYQPHRLPVTVVTSSRRWEQHGVIKTVLTMWMLRLLYWLGVSPAHLARWY